MFFVYMSLCGISFQVVMPSASLETRRYEGLASKVRQDSDMSLAA